MSRFSGPQFRGAGRQARAERRRAIAKKQRETAVLRAADARSCPGKVRFATKELAMGRHTAINAIVAGKASASSALLMAENHMAGTGAVLAQGIAASMPAKSTS